MNRYEAYLFFSTMPKLELKERYKLINALGSVENVFLANEAKLRESGISERIISVILSHKQKFNINEVDEKLYKYNARYIPSYDSSFPEKLKTINYPPVGLFVIGELPDENVPSVSIIGSRICSEYGKEITCLFGEELAESGIQIISGLAMGIDGYSHRAALKKGGKTFGILGGSIFSIYPRDNADLYKEMYLKGGVISEYYDNESNFKIRFPERNRLIAGFCDCLLVVEARKKSGTMITIDRALEQGKEIFVIPGRIGDELSEGCLKIANEGAHIALDPDDIAFALKDMFPNFVHYTTDKENQYTFISDDNKLLEKKLKNSKLGIEKDEIIVYSLIRFEPIHLDQLISLSGLGYFELLSIVNTLVDKNLIKEVGAEYYSRL